MKELKLSIEQIFRHKSYSAIIVTTILICVGINLLVFNLINSLYINTNITADDSLLARVYERYSDQSGNLVLWGTSPVLFYEREELSRLIDEIGLYRYHDLNLSHESGILTADYRTIYEVTPSLFRVFNVKPLLGRIFEDSEGKVGGNNRVVIITYQYWISNFAGDPDILGTTMWMDGEPHEIIGVMPESFDIPSYSSDARRDGIFRLACFRPVIIYENSRSGNARFYTHYGCWARLKPGHTLAELEVEFNQLNDLTGPRNPKEYERAKEVNHRTHVISIGEDIMRNTKSVMLLIQVGTFLLLIVGCSSVATVIFGRNIERAGEVATRAALGAGMWSSIRPFLLEICALVFVGTSLGLLLALVGLKMMSHYGFFDLFVIAPRVSLDPTTVGVSFLVALLVVFLVTLLSVLPVAMKIDIIETLKNNSRVGSSRLLNIYKGCLLFVQIAITTILLVVGGLLYRSFQKVVNVDTGFNPENIMTAAVRLPPAHYDTEDRVLFMRYLKEELTMQPFIETVGICNWIPLKLFSRWVRDVYVEGVSNPSDERGLGQCTIDMIYGDFFEVLNVKLLQGRYFNTSDYHNQRPVAIIDSRVAEQFFGNENPIGRRIAVSTPYQNQELDWLEIIGVVKSFKTNSLTRDSNIGGRVFQNAQRTLPFSNGLVIRTNSKRDLPSAITALRNVLDQRDPHLGIILPESMEHIVQRNYKDHKNKMFILLGIAVAALILCTVGISGSINQSIASRKRDIGVKIALGAPTSRLLWECMSYWVKIGMTGIAAGIIVSGFVSTRISESLYGISNMDPITYIFVFLFLSGIVVISSYCSSKKVMGINPADTLRSA